MNLKTWLGEEIGAVVRARWGQDLSVSVAYPPRPEMGDYASNVGFLLARALRRPPHEISAAVAEDLRAREGIREATPSGGFVNIVLDEAWLMARFRDLSSRDFPPLPPRNLRVLLEFVSANPTGPLNVVSARAAAVGDTWKRLLRFAGIQADAEYYVNDAGGQIRALQESLEYFAGLREEFPEDGYRGAYVEALARRLLDERVPREAWARTVVDWILEEQMAVLRDYRVDYDSVVRESWIRRSGYPQKVREKLAPYLYAQDGAVVFRSTAFPQFGDDKDRVVIRSNGEPTYFFWDLAYHLYKADRGYHRLVDLLGPDHQGYVPRMKAGLEALGVGGDRLEVLIVQQVNLFREGKRVRMSKRKGEFYEMRTLMEEVGVDAARFFMLLRAPSTPLDFDLTLARRLSQDNPVYYVQYTHARTVNLLRYGQEQGLAPDPEGLSRLDLPEERALVLACLRLYETVEDASRTGEVHRLVQYLLDLSRTFHAYYQNVRIVTENRALSRARLALVDGIRKAVARGLELAGVEAPESM